MAKASGLVVLSWADQSHYTLGASLTADGDLLRIPATNTYPSAWPNVDWDLTSSQFVAELVAPPNVSNGSTNSNMGVYSYGSSRDAYFGWEDNQLRVAFQDAGGSWTYHGFNAYSPASHRFLRIREEGGTLYFEAGPDPDTFPTLVHSRAVVWSVAAIRPYLGAGNWNSASSPGYATWGVVNPPPPPTGPVTSLKLQDGSWQDVTWARIP